MSVGIPVHYAVEPELLGSTGAITFTLIGTDPNYCFLVKSSDFLADLDIGASMTTHRETSPMDELVESGIKSDNRVRIVHHEP
jgi:hypothetical protein